MSPPPPSRASASRAADQDRWGERRRDGQRQIHRVGTLLYWGNLASGAIFL